MSDKLKSQYEDGTRQSYFVDFNDGSFWKGKKHSDETKNKLSIINTGKKMDDNFKDKRRIEMLNRYKNGWESTAGRTKKIEYHSPIAGLVKVDGSWELKVCKYFDENKINWLRNKKRFDYIDKDLKKRTYCPDFYLVDIDTYIEVKGYKTELDEYKWKFFNNKLEIWDKNILKEKNIL